MEQGHSPQPAHLHGRPVLVTGATGFVGANLARRLADIGAEVHFPLRPESSTWRLDSVMDAMRPHHGDLTDPSFVDALVDEVRPAAVYHLAAYGSNQAQSDPQQIVRVNVTGTLNLLQAAARTRPDVFVYAGTSSEYGSVSGAMDEAAPTHPLSHYAITKLAGTHLCSLYARQEGLNTVTFRLFTVYGPWMEPARLIPAVMAKASRREPVHLTARPVHHDFVYVDDVIDALLSVPSAGMAPGDILNLCSAEQHSNQDVVRLIGEVMQRQIEIVSGGYPEHSWDIENWVGSNRRVRECLDWRPETSFPEGLARTWAWMREHPGKYGI